MAKASETKAAASTVEPAAAPSIEAVDLPQLAETFADSIQSIFFDGQSLRINFGVTRMGEMRPNQPPQGRRYPSCRLVLSPSAALDLINQLRQVGAALEKAGVLKSTARQASTPS